ncbi:MerR family transcriptional regulator [Streptomyces sp. HNM0574]|uniref:MerR family transcriptional regulator n=1 Tax=Streptomyces sp. HNM0574 TaxID=2714954 RepID=UPI00146BA8D5|nr:MerR family transcriptional regulator [Streptomyces sp. HNM0574]NLU68666.1 redoxin family protein [Streptomyces sp. HNM0574]
MRIGELAARAGVTAKAVRYYERLGLVRPVRRANGYREYAESDVLLVAEIRALAQVGIAPGRAAPFVECLVAGHEHSDDCPSSLSAYRDGIVELDRSIAALTARRDALAARLAESASRTFTTARSEEGRPVPNYLSLPDDLPEPVDDGAARHLPGRELPPLRLPATDGGEAGLADLGEGRSVVYIYPLTGLPGVDMPAGWDAIPGARGCTPESCGFRDHFEDLKAAGAGRVYGLSSQSSGYQREAAERLNLPFAMLSDPQLALADALDLPTFEAGGERLYKRLTLIVTRGAVEHVFYPVFPPNEHAGQVLDWLRTHPSGA